MHLFSVDGRFLNVEPDNVPVLYLNITQFGAVQNSE